MIMLFCSYKIEKLSFYFMPFYFVLYVVCKGKIMSL